MGLLSFLKRKSNDEPTRPTKAAAAVPDSPDTVQQARTRARQRLVGAVVLVAAGVIGFPLLFETQPRPLPGDLPIEIARKDGNVSPAPAPTPRATPAPRANTPPATEITESPAEAGREVAVASAPAPAPDASVATPKPSPEPKPEPKPAEPKPEAKPPAKPASKPADSTRAQALLDGKDAKPAAAAAGDGRFIVQVGAFAEVTAAREARQKVEKLGLKTYTQVVETSGGKRIRVRVGPFASRDEADKASARIKSAGLSPAVYTL